MNGTMSIPIVQAAFPPAERSGRRKTSMTARTHRKRKRTMTAPRMNRIRVTLRVRLYAVSSEALGPDREARARGAVRYRTRHDRGCRGRLGRARARGRAGVRRGGAERPL